MKGILLAGGTGSRLFPVTYGINKHLIPVYDKPMIYYPLSSLMLAKITEILLITNKESINSYKSVLSDGSQWGISINYMIQEKANGIAEAFLLAEEFIGNENVALILGDNIIHGEGIGHILERASTLKEGAIIFAYYVNNPSDYGIVEFSSNGEALSIEEKPENPKSSYAVPGIYFYDNRVIEYAKSIKPSKRGELEITAINEIYLNKKALKVEMLGRGTAWLDAGTHSDLLEANNYVATIERRTGLKIACPEEIALRLGYIDEEKLIKLAKLYNNEYGMYLSSLIKSNKRYFR